MSEENKNAPTGVTNQPAATLPAGQEQVSVPAQPADTAANPQPASQNPPRRKPRTNCRRTGKVARLPLGARHCVSYLLYQGKSYRQILEFLEEEGYKGIKRQNITNWVQGGHKDWLQQQAQLESILIKRDNLQALAWSLGRGRHFDLGDVNNALLATRFNEVLQQIDTKQIASSLASNPELLFRFAAEESLRQKRETEVIRDREQHEDRKRRHNEADSVMKFAMLNDEQKARLRSVVGKPEFQPMLCEMIGVKRTDSDDDPASS